MPRPFARRATTTSATTTSSATSNNNSDNKNNNNKTHNHSNNEIVNARFDGTAKTDSHRYKYEGHSSTKNGTASTSTNANPPLNVSALSNNFARQGLSGEKKPASTCLSTQSLDNTNQQQFLKAHGISLTATNQPIHQRLPIPLPPMGPTNLLHICCSDDNSSPYLLQIYLHREPRLALSYDENGYLPLHHAILSHNVEKTSLLLQAQPETVEARCGLSDSTLSLAYKSLRRDDPRGGVIINLLERLIVEGSASVGASGSASGRETGTAEELWIPQMNSMGHGYLYQQLMNSRYSIETSRQQLNNSLSLRQEFEEVDEDDDSEDIVEVISSSSSVAKQLTVPLRVDNDDDDEDKGATHDSKPSTVISPKTDSDPSASIPPTHSATPTSGSHLMKMCSDNKWTELDVHITQNPRCITSILTHYKTNIEDIRDDDCQTTTILHRVLRSRSTDLCGRVTVINTILQSPHAVEACAIRSKPLGALPLHVALHRDNKMDTATREQVIAALVKVYPEATIAQTAGKTPLHIMSRQYSSTAIAKMLITACPAAAKIRDDKGWLPIHHACRWRSSPEKLKLLIDAYPESVFLKTEYECLKPMDLILANATKTRPHLALIGMLKESMEVLGGERGEQKEDIRTMEEHNKDIRTIVVTADTTGSQIPAKKTAPKIPAKKTAPKIPAKKTASKIPAKKPPTPTPPLPSPPSIPLIHVKKVTSDDKALLALCKANDWHSVEKHIQLHPHSATSVLRDRNSNGTTVLHKVFASSSTDYASRIQVIDRSLQIAPQLAAVKNGCGSLPLHLAARNSYKIQIDTKTQEDVIKSLIRVYPSAAVTQNAAGRTPLHIACAHFCSSGVLRLLLNAGKEAASKQDRQGCLPIHLACRRSCSVDKLELLLEAYPESVLVKSKAGLTPLCVALMDFSNNPRQSSRFILTLKGKLDFINKKKQKDGRKDGPKDGEVPVTAVPVKPPVTLIHYDHNTNPNPNTTTPAKTTPSTSPTPLTDTDMEAAATIKFLRSSTSPPTTPPPSPLIDVVTCNLNACVLSICRANAWKEVEEFIQIANPSLDEMGTILHHVLKTKKGSLRERTDLISFLLARNPDAALVKSSHTGSLPLHVALGKSNGMDEHMRRHVVSLLISHHPSAIAVQEREKGRTPLHAAFINRYSTSTVKLMLDANPKAVKIKDSGGWLPIHHACKRSCPSEQLELLIELYPESLVVLTGGGESLSDLAINFAKDGSARLALLKESERQFMDGKKEKGDKKRGEEEMRATEASVSDAKRATEASATDAKMTPMKRATEASATDAKMTPMKRAPSGGWMESAPPLKKRKCGLVPQEAA